MSREKSAAEGPQRGGGAFGLRRRVGRLWPVASARAADADPLRAAVLVALLLRVWTACTSQGFFAADDYHLGVEQAWRWLEAPGWHFPYPFRSPLIALICLPPLGLARGLGLSCPGSAVRVLYLCLGAWSVLALPPVHRLARRTFGAQVAAVASWLMAGYALMPIISCRALVEVVAIVPLAWSLWWLDRARRGDGVRWAVAAGAGLGAACLCRFQIGVLWPPALWAVAAAGPAGRLRRAAACLAGGGVMAAAQGALDLAFGRWPGETVWAYLAFNLRHSAADFGSSPPTVYPLFFLGLTLPPMTLALAGPLWRAARAMPHVAACWAVFVASHTLMGHKEDRFMFPMMPLFLIALAYALHACWRAGGARRGAAAAFAAVNLAVLPVLCASDAQRNITVPLLRLLRESPRATVATVALRMAAPEFYLGRQRPTFAVDDVSGLAALPEPARRQVAQVLWQGRLSAADRHSLDAALGRPCAPPEVFEGDLVDRLLVRVNRRNARRDAISLLRCPVSADALPAAAAQSRG